MNENTGSLFWSPGQGSPRHVTQVTPSKIGGNSKEDLISFYRHAGLDTLAKDVSDTLVCSLSADQALISCYWK